MKEQGIPFYNNPEFYDKFNLSAVYYHALIEQSDKGREFVERYKSILQEYGIPFKSLTKEWQKYLMHDVDEELEPKGMNLEKWEKAREIMKEEKYVDESLLKEKEELIYLLVLFSLFNG